MERRELLKMIAALTGVAVIGGDLFLSGCTTGTKAEAGFSASQVALLDEIAETIIPATNTPGAKAAQVGEFMKTMVTDCYTAKQQEAFLKGLTSLEDACKKTTGKSFMDCNAEQRHTFLVSLEKEAKAFNTKRDEEDKPKREAHEAANQQLPWKEQAAFEETPSHYYTMMKQLTLLGYFTSKPGVKEALRYLPVPGKYDGAYPYTKGDKAFS
jgi:hypothetical protein